MNRTMVVRAQYHHTGSLKQAGAPLQVEGYNSIFAIDSCSRLAYSTVRRLFWDFLRLTRNRLTIKRITTNRSVLAAPGSCARQAAIAGVA